MNVVVRNYRKLSKKGKADFKALRTRYLLLTKEKYNWEAAAKLQTIAQWLQNKVKPSNALNRTFAEIEAKIIELEHVEADPNVGGENMANNNM